MWARGGVGQPVFYGSSVRFGLGSRNGPLARARAPAIAVALLEVVEVVRVVGIGGPTDFNMALNGCAGGGIEREHLASALPGFEPDAEEPRFGCRREVLAFLPGSRLIGVASFGPAQQLPKDMMVQPVEGPLGGSMPVVIGPTPSSGVGFEQERLLG